MRIRKKDATATSSCLEGSGMLMPLTHIGIASRETGLDIDFASLEHVKKSC